MGDSPKVARALNHVAYPTTDTGATYRFYTEILGFKLVAAVRGGLLSLEEACARYTLTVEEFLAWQYSIDQHGLAGLRTTRIQQYRQ